MRYAMLCLLPVVALLVAADDQADKDKKAMQGTWKVTSFESGGKAAPEDKVKAMKLTIKDDTFSLTDGQRTETGKFTFDAAKKPKELDLTPDKGNNGKAQFIYDIDGDTLKFCWNKPGGARPKEFTGKDTDGYMILKREK